MAVIIDVVLNDQTLHLDPVRLIGGVEQPSPARCRHAIVPDQRIGQHQDLPGIRGVRQGFDVAGHPGVEDDLSTDRAWRTEEAACENGPVVQYNWERLRTGFLRRNCKRPLHPWHSFRPLTVRDDQRTWLSLEFPAVG